MPIVPSNLNPVAADGTYAFDRTATVRNTRWAEAARLRLTGLTYGQIAAQVGYLNANGVPVPGAARHAVARFHAEAARSPMNRRFGVEFEVVGLSTNRAAIAVGRVGVDCRDEGYNHTTRGYWKAVPDASIGRHNAEVVSPILQGTDGFAQIGTVLGALKDAGARASVSCGIHVHLDAADLSDVDIATFTALYGMNEPVIDTLVPISRRGNRSQWARTVGRGSNAADVAEARMGRGSRYRKVNLVALRAHGTVEIRQFGSSTEPVKVTTWVQMLMAMVAMAKDLVATGTDVTAYATMAEFTAALSGYGLPAFAVAYLNRRSARVTAALAA